MYSRNKCLQFTSNLSIPQAVHSIFGLLLQITSKTDCSFVRKINCFNSSTLYPERLTHDVVKLESLIRKDSSFKAFKTKLNV